MEPKLLEDYHAQRELRRAFLKALKDDLREHLKSEKIRFVDIPWRVKEEASFLRKIRKNPGLFKTISDVHDFCGLRVITYLREDIENTIAAIGQRYELTEIVDRSPSDPTKFGYISHHARIKFHQASPLRKRFEGLYAEIQVRTILQHAWAEIEHDLGYKNDIGIPTHLRRRFSLISGLLEIGDREFDELRLAISKHVSELSSKSEGDWSEVGVDSHSLQHFCEQSEALRDAASGVRSAVGAAPNLEHEYVRNVSSLDFLRIETLGSLDILLTEQGAAAISLACRHLAERGPHSYFADADMLDYLAICKAASVGLFSLQQLLSQVEGTGSEIEDSVNAQRWFELYQRASGVE
jgi:putative GTP pyrophosphokinase